MPGTVGQRWSGEVADAATTTLARGRFALGRRLGAGATGIVYEAHDHARDAAVAVKTLRRDDPHALLLLKREFRVLRDVAHPNLVRLGELFEDDGAWFFTMELVAGVDLIAHVRAAPRAGFAGCDEARVCDAFAQLARGLDALHAAGKVHRDVKPSNVLVAPDGRVVVLDFGLASDADDGDADAVRFGTAAYAPPEASRREAGDWYALGVMLFEALTGELPFDGHPARVLARKRAEDAPPPSARARGIPPRLDALCAALLARDPARRANGDDVARALVPTSKAPPAAARSRSVAPPFVGRAAEMARLDAALERVARGETWTVAIEGESGLGKSALVRAFAERARERHAACVLASRCFEREIVPYKAFDGAVDALTRFVRSLPDEEAAALIPRHAALLARAFPVLAGLWRMDDRLDARAAAVRDPQEQRARVFVAFRELLARIAARRTVVLVLDDVQWADADSLALMRELARPPDAPPILTVLLARTGGAAAWTATIDAESLALGPLADDDAAELLRRAEVDALGDDRRRAIVREAHGHPLFLSELLRFAADRDRPPIVSLDDALADRVRRLDDDARAVVEIVALAGVPIGEVTVRRAAGADAAAVSAAIAGLRAAHLVRATAGEVVTIEPYHDRVREAIGARVEPTRRAAIHARIARALEAEANADPDLLGVHWEQAGDPARAATFFVRAAERAAAALSFDNAATLYARALRLGVGDAAARHDARVRLAEALANAGRGADAARACADAIAGAPPAQAMELRRLAAEQLVASGHFAEGKAALGEVLAAVGERFAPSQAAALVLALARRLWLRVRGHRLRSRPAETIDARALARLDALFATSTLLTSVNAVVSMDFSSRFTLAALRAGEPIRAALALGGLALGVGVSLARGAEVRARRLLDEAERLLASFDAPLPRAYVGGVASFLAYFVGDWRASCDAAERTTALLLECPRPAWYLATVRRCELASRFHLGDLATLRSRVPELLADAARRNDLYALATCGLGTNALVWLIDDAPARARAQTDAIAARWPTTELLLPHFHALSASAQTDLYEGLAEEAWARVDAQWRALERALYLRVRSIAFEAHHLRGRAALACAARRASGSREQRRFLAVAAASARSLRSNRLRWSDAVAASLDAGARFVVGDLDGARRDLRDAIARLDACGMALHAAAARLRLAAIAPDAADATGDLARARRYFAEQRVARPDRFARMLVPGFDRPEEPT